jgi:hypothetical protein
MAKPKPTSPGQTNFLALLQPPVALDPHVVLASDPRFKLAIQELTSAPRYIGLKTEYHGPWSTRRDIDHTQAIIRLISIALPSGMVIVAEPPDLLEALPAVLSSRSTLKVGQALKGDIVALECNLGLKTRGCRDLMLMSQVLWAGVGAAKPKKPKNRVETPEERQRRLKFVGLRHTLGAIASRCGIPYTESHPDRETGLPYWAGKLSNADYNQAAHKAQVVLPVWRRLGAWVKDAELIDSVMAECEALPAFAECEVHGLPVDWATLNNAIKKWTEAKDRVLAQWKETFPTVDPMKKEKVAVALSNALHLSGDDRLYSLGEPGKNGKRKILPRVNDETLVPYDSETPGNKDAAPERRRIYRAVHAYLEHNSISTQLAYLLGFKAHYRRGHVRPKFFQIAMGNKPGKEQETGKGMGRASAYDPNTTNSPNLQPAHKAVGLPHPRSVVKPAAEHSLIVADLSNGHARIATQASLDPELIRIFSTGGDAHCNTAFGLLKLRGVDLTYEGLFALYTQAKKYAKAVERGEQPKPIPQLAHDIAATRLLAKPVFFGCVTYDAQALTRQGWRTVDQLVIGEEILAYNVESGRNEWTPLLALNRYNGPVYDLSFGAKWKVRCTMDHRWYGSLATRIPGAYKNTGGLKSTHRRVDCWTTTADMPSGFRVKVSAPSDGGPGLKDWRITPKKYEVDWVPFVLKMTPEERRAFLTGCLISEGHITKPRKGEGRSAWVLSQNEGNLGEAMWLAAYLEGYKVTVNNDNHKHGRVWRMRLCAKEVVTGQKLTKTFAGVRRVWCPTTKFGTWVMRQGSTITITGNSLNIQGAPTLKKTAETGPEPVFMTLEQAAEGISVWRLTYAGLYAFQRATIRKANEYNVRFDQPGVGPYSLNLPGEYAVVRGLSNRRLFLLKETDKHGRHSCKGTDCVSFVWMGTEADIIKRAMGRLQAEFDRHPEWGARLANFCHDEINLVCLKVWENEVAQTVQRVMDECMTWVIKVIPVSDGDWKSLIVGSWAAK